MSPDFTVKTWTHVGLILDSYWTHLETGKKKVPRWYEPAIVRCALDKTRKLISG